MIRISRRLQAFALGAVLVLTGLLFQPSRAQTPATGTIALTGVRVIDGTGRAPLEQATMIIRNGRITAVGAPATTTIPTDATRVDLAGKTVMPGLINAHAHVNVNLNVKTPVRDQLLQRLRMYTNYGVTAVVSLGAEETDEAEGIKIRDEQRSGSGPAAVDAPRFYDAGRPVLFRPGPVGTETAEDARKDVARHAALKVDIIKFHVDAIPQDLKPDVYGALIDEAHKRGLRVAVHIFNLKDAKETVARGVDVIAHSVRDQDVDAAFIGELKRRNVGYIPTLTRDLSVFVYETTPAFFTDPFFLRGISLYKTEVDLQSSPAQQEKIRAAPLTQAIKKALEQANRNLKLLSDAGVTIAMGTDSGASPDRNPGRWQGYFEHVELEMMVKAGLTPMQALVAATGGAARVMKLDGVGTLEPGKWADLLVLNANPLADIRNTRQINSVWLAGRKLTVAP